MSELVFLLWQVAKANFETPMLLCHGEADPLVSVDFGRLSYERIKQFNKKVQFKTYPGLRHWVHDEVRFLCIYICVDFHFSFSQRQSSMPSKTVF